MQYLSPWVRPSHGHWFAGVHYEIDRSRGNHPAHRCCQCGKCQLGIPQFTRQQFSLDLQAEDQKKQSLQAVIYRVKQLILEVHVSRCHLDGQ